jgi:hypothetical protein
MRESFKLDNRRRISKILVKQRIDSYQEKQGENSKKLEKQELNAVGKSNGKFRKIQLARNRLAIEMEISKKT